MLTVVGERPAIGPFELHERLEETMRLPQGVDPGRATARYRGRSLEIHIPKVNTGHRVIPISSLETRKEIR